MRIVFAGAGAFALEPFRRLRELDIQLAMVITRPDRPKGRGRRVGPTPVAEEAQRVGFPVTKTDRIAALTDTVQYLRADVLLVADFGEIIPESVLSIPRLGPFNLHASLLPRWRGAAPCPKAILAGDEKTGVTFFRMTKGMDAGPILLQREAPILPADTAETLETRLSREAALMLGDALELLKSGGFALREQDPVAITFAPKLAKHEGAIPWRADARAVLRHVRAMQPWPRAYSFLTSARHAPLRMNVLAADHLPAPCAAPPGTVLAVHADAFDAACGTDAVRVRTVQAAGKRVMTCAEFLRGHAVRAGDVFTSNEPGASPALEL